MPVPRFIARGYRFLTRIRFSLRSYQPRFISRNNCQRIAEDRGDQTERERERECCTRGMSCARNSSREHNGRSNFSTERNTVQIALSDIPTKLQYATFDREFIISALGGANAAQGPIQSRNVARSNASPSTPPTGVFHQ